MCRENLSACRYDVYPFVNRDLVTLTASVVVPMSGNLAISGKPVGFVNTASGQIELHVICKRKSHI